MASPALPNALKSRSSGMPAGLPSQIFDLSFKKSQKFIADYQIVILHISKIRIDGGF